MPEQVYDTVQVIMYFALGNHIFFLKFRGYNLLVQFMVSSVKGQACLMIIYDFISTNYGIRHVDDACN